VEPLDLPAMTLVLVPQDEGLATAAVYRELDRLGAFSPTLDPEPLRMLAARRLDDVAAGLANDLQPAALSLRPKLSQPIAQLLDAGALAAQVAGSGPTTFGVFADRAAAKRAAERIPAAIVTGLNA
jgi:4-diphosphocytidyl-2-C-methyl-D-erythritol kinase